MDTILLDANLWDCLVDASGNIAVASQPYSQAQDAASAIRTFQGECYYDVALGVPYWTQILGMAVPLSLLKQYFVDAALTVPGTASATCFISSFTDRKITGQVQITNSDGSTSTAGF